MPLHPNKQTTTTILNKINIMGLCSNRGMLLVHLLEEVAENRSYQLSIELRRIQHNQWVQQRLMSCRLRNSNRSRTAEKVLSIFSRVEVEVVVMVMVIGSKRRLT